MEKWVWLDPDVSVHVIIQSDGYSTRQLSLFSSRQSISSPRHVMEATLKRLKEQRKSLKSKITRTANALKQAVTDKCHAEAKSLHQSLVDLFRSQYMNLHYDYVEALEDSVDCSFDLEPYKVVNGMSCDQHLEAVSQVFSDASDLYVNFCQLSERAELSALVDLP